MRRDILYLNIRISFLFLLLASCGVKSTASYLENTIIQPGIIVFSTTATRTLTTTLLPTATPSPILAQTPNQTISYPLKMGSIITKENAAQIELLGSIKENLTESLIGSHLAWSPDGKEIALTTNGDGVRIIDPLTMKEVGEIKQNVQGLIDRPSDVAYSPDGKTIAIAIPTGIFSYPNNVAFYDVITHKTVQKTIHWSGINIINYSHNGRWFTYGSDGTIFVINLQNIQGKELMRYDSDDESRFNYAIFSPNDKYFAFAGMDFPVQIYDTSSWNSVYKYDGGGGGLCFSPDNKYFVNGKGIWSMDNINIVKEFGRELYINVCDYGINGDIIINGEAPIQILDAKTGEVLNLLKGDKDIFDIALSPDGRFIASLGSDKYDSIKLWGIPV